MSTVKDWTKLIESLKAKDVHAMDGNERAKHEQELREAYRSRNEARNEGD